MSRLRWTAAALSLALVLGVASWEVETLTAPGPLHGSHDLPELIGARGCPACHGDSGTAMAQACAVCHAAVGAQIAQGRGLHGQLEHAASACGTCHGEHAGGRVALVSAHSFQRSGIENRDAYDHRHTPGFALAGRHRELACARCHARAERETLAWGEPRFLGLDQRCRTCHDDPHRGRLGEECASCHGQEQPFARVAAFAHDAAFPLAGAHAGLACTACHARGGERSVEALHGKRAPPRACGDCHASKHRPEFLSSLAALAEPATCSTCHAVARGAFARPAARMPAELHRSAGFALAPPHHTQDCAACHEAAPGERAPPRAAADCRACHGDPHGGQLDAGRTRGRCVECHARTHFVPSTIGPAEHARGRFPLTGAHQAVACTRCHAPEPKPQRFVPLATACSSCHRDVHGGRFDRPELPAQVSGQQGCARCHEASSFHDTRLDPQAHGLWTGYALHGAHAAAACTACHPRGQDQTLGQAPRDCAACHHDPHQGQLARQGRTDCGRCHDPAARFPSLRFDHARDARFALDARHRALACSSCHRPAQARDGTRLVRYRPLGTRCQDCHDSRPAAARLPGGAR